MEISKKAAKSGFEWPDMAGVLAKLREEIAELEAELNDESLSNEAVRQRISEENLDQGFGHSTSRTGRKYGQGVPMDVMKEDFDRIEFRSVEWDPVVRCARIRLERMKRGAPFRHSQPRLRD